MIVATIGIALVLIALAGAAGGNRDRPSPSTAGELLDARLARGEISADEHRQRRDVLTEEAPPRASRTLLWLVAGVGVVLLVVGPWSTMPGTGTGWWAGHQRDMEGRMGWNRTATAPAEPPVAGAPEVLVEAGDLWFDPARVEVEAGSTVNLVLDNTGQVFHDLSIPDLDVHLEAGAGETAATALSISEAGRYEFLCTVPGHATGGCGANS
jgi:plastocyanin